MICLFINSLNCALGVHSNTAIINSGKREKNYSASTSINDTLSSLIHSSLTLTHPSLTHSFIHPSPTHTFIRHSLTHSFILITIHSLTQPSLTQLSFISFLLHFTLLHSPVTQLIHIHSTH